MRKEWTVWHRVQRARKSKSRGFDTRLAATKFMAEVVNSGESITNIKWHGKNISAEDTFELIGEARLQIIQTTSSR